VNLGPWENFIFVKLVSMRSFYVVVESYIVQNGFNIEYMIFFPFR
jgi:hypothetical protein